MTQPNPQAVKHTPLPWHDEDGFVFTENEVRVADCHCDYQDNIEGQEEADAAFIVRACNSHYELLEALKNMVNDVNSLVAFPPEKLSTARAAIAKAEARS